MHAVLVKKKTKKKSFCNKNSVMISSGSGSHSQYKHLLWFCSGLEYILPLCTHSNDDWHSGNTSQTATLYRERTETINEMWSVTTFFILQVETCVGSYYLINSWAYWQIPNTVLSVPLYACYSSSFLLNIWKNAPKQ